MLGLLALAPDTVGAPAVTTFTLEPVPIAAAFFAVGSMIFAWLLLRGRMVPTWLGWVGFIGSALLVVGLPLQIAHVLAGAATQLMWIPVAVFELVFAVWLIITGAPLRARGP